MRADPVLIVPFLPVWRAVALMTSVQTKYVLNFMDTSILAVNPAGVTISGQMQKRLELSLWEDKNIPQISQSHKYQSVSSTPSWDSELHPFLC